MATATQIREKALKKLGVKATGTTTSNTIADDLDAAYTEVYAELDGLSLITWDFDEEIPDQFVGSVVALVAYARVDEYSIPNDRYVRIVNDEVKALPKIKELQAGDEYKPVTAEYF